MELLNVTLVQASIFHVAPLNVQAEAAPSGSGETQALLQAAQAADLRVGQEACVIELHQGPEAGRVVAAIEPRNGVEKRRRESARDDVALELRLVSLPDWRRPLLRQIDPKVIC